MDNKKVLTISIVAVVVLVIAIISTSYATFSAQISGEKENKLTTGYVTLKCDEEVFTLNDTSPMTDEEGIALESNEAVCTLSSEMKGEMTVGYDIALDDVDAETPDDDLTENDVKVQIYKITNEQDPAQTKYLQGTSENTGTYIANLKEKSGTYDTESVENYLIDSDKITGTTQVIYKVKAWVSNNKNGVENIQTNSVTNSDDGVCSNSEYNTQAECESAGEVWGNSQKSTQTGGTFSFKLKIGATQILEDE